MSHNTLKRCSSKIRQMFATIYSIVVSKSNYLKCYALNPDWITLYTYLGKSRPVKCRLFFILFSQHNYDHYFDFFCLHLYSIPCILLYVLLYPLLYLPFYLSSGTDVQQVRLHVPDQPCHCMDSLPKKLCNVNLWCKHFPIQG